MLGVIGIVSSLLLLMYLAYRGITVLLLAPILAAFAVLLNGDLPLLATYTEVFMKSFAGFAKAFFPLFLLGAVFGKMMDASGSARSISQWITGRLGPSHAISSIVLSCAVLTYGGVSLFVVAFAVYPIAAAMFREANIPKRLIPGALALGSFTFSMTALPGTPQIQNSIPMPYFATDIYAAPVIGVVCGLIMCGLGILWLSQRARRAQLRGEGYGAHADALSANDDESASTAAVAPIATATTAATATATQASATAAKANVNASSLPPVLVALLPIFVMLGLNLFLTKVYFPSVDTSYLTAEPYLTSSDKVVGLWSLIISMTAAILAVVLLNFRRFRSAVESLNEGAYGSMLAILNTSSEVGYGNVIASLAGFVVIKDAMLGLSDNPLIAESVSITTLAGITGSASGGLSIALAALGETYLSMAHAAGISAEVLHRIATIACGGMDSLPHNGAVITLLAICGLTHRQSYLDIGMTTVVIPLFTLVVGIGLAMMGVV